MSARNGKIIAATDRCRGRAHSGQGENGNESYLTRKWCSWYTYSVDTRKGKQGGYNGTVKKRIHLRPCHAFNLRQANLAVTALYDKYLHEAGVTVQQYSVLWHIKELGPLSITSLSLEMNLDRTTLSRNITLLEQRGFVENVPSTGRKHVVQLTDQGEKLFFQAQTAWQAAQYELEQRLGKDGMAQLENLLLRIIE